MTRGERRRFQKRIRIIQRNIILSVLSILLISGLALTMNGIKSFAQKDNAELTYKYYTSIVVKYGDTLYSLAEEYAPEDNRNLSEYVNEVMHINHLENHVIQSGQYLIIPYYSADLKGI